MIGVFGARAYGAPALPFLTERAAAQALIGRNRRRQAATAARP